MNDLRDKCFGRGFDSHHLHQYKLILVICNYIVYYIKVKKIKIVILIVAAAAIITCTAEDNSDIIAEYGEPYFTMTCWWHSQANFAPSIWHCSDMVESDLISGYISLAVEEDLNSERFLSICGRDIELNSGHSLHDLVIPALTENNYNCIDTYERDLGDEFDWLWDEEARTLQLIWRGDDGATKILTLLIDLPTPTSARSEGNVYYKTIDPD